MPHGRIDAKYDQKKRLGELNELAVGYSPAPLACGFALIVDRNCTIATSECLGLCRVGFFCCCCRRAESYLLSAAERALGTLANSSASAADPFHSICFFEARKGQG